MEEAQPCHCKKKQQLRERQIYTSPSLSSSSQNVTQLRGDKNAGFAKQYKRTTESKDKVEDDDDPHSTLAGPRPSHHDIRVPKLKQTADSTAMPLATGNKSSHMPLRKDDTLNGGKV
ncbi:hypothetical protein P5673_033665 [Acropora cervicornis]|uniref:Uncharacterized protein n=1 Tax=Acropora cervicornis TaxID=6130 RepID=A0AAD9PPM9_ACRCE|nr:hypothetical protein P5673_033665 [Acropora cervicornis]